MQRDHLEKNGGWSQCTFLLCASEIITLKTRIIFLRGLPSDGEAISEFFMLQKIRTGKNIVLVSRH